VKNIVFILIGAAIAAVGLQFFLVPNHLIDGGVVGISIIASKLFNLPLAVFLIILNVPFIFLGYKKIGKQFALYSTLGVGALAAITVLVHSPHAATTTPILAAVFGGMIVGVGVGLVIRYGGTLDGTDTVGILIDRRTPFSIGEGIMFINIFILIASGFVFGWDNAMYSIIAYFVAHKSIDITVEGMNESRSVWIVSKKYREVGEAIYRRTGRKVTYVNGKTDEAIVSDGVVLAVITRFEEQRLKTVVYEVDESAFIVISGAHEIIGKSF
jgi:uncharacterized membrane-anchored protein YitT (DUF2179 family)